PAPASCRRKPIQGRSRRSRSNGRVVDAGEARRTASGNRNRGTGGRNPSAAALAVEEYAVPGIAELARSHSGPPRVYCPDIGTKSVGGISCGDRVVVADRKPIKRCLGADDHAAPELVVDADLAAASKLSIGPARKGAAKGVGNVCAGESAPAGTHVAADVE